MVDTSWLTPRPAGIKISAALDNKGEEDNTNEQPGERFSPG